MCKFTKDKHAVIQALYYIESFVVFFRSSLEIGRGEKEI
jgi:hypothetical protein